ncbi:MAG UNVERIFIED_CONTAM: aminoacyltransferase [Anaerolineae bacterium]
MLDISHSEDDILANMSQNTRRKVRLSERKGIRYYHGTLDDIEVFTPLDEHNRRTQRVRCA